MGKPLRKPALASPAHRQLNEFLHELHARANYPSPYSIAPLLGVTRTTLYNAMSKEKLPTKDVAVRLALAYGAEISWGPTADPAEELDRIDRRVSALWEHARWGPQSQQLDPDRVKRVVQNVWDDLGSGQGPYPQSHVLAQAVARSTISIAVIPAERYVSVLVDASDQDTRRTLGCYAEGSFSSYPWRAEVAGETRARLAPDKISILSVDLAEDSLMDFWP